MLLTNLFNRVQPLIRYELPDVVTMDPEPCPCGRTLRRLGIADPQVTIEACTELSRSAGGKLQLVVADLEQRWRLALGRSVNRSPRS